MSIDKLQKQRFEIKYIINEHKAQMIRPFVQDNLTIDEYGATQPDLSYPVHSLYLDSPAMRTYRETINGDRNRFKLRIRYYDNGSDSPVFFEIKRRFDEVIAKKRSKVKRSAVEDLIGGHFPTMEHLVHKTDEQLEALKHFCKLVNELNARPKVHVAYKREAYELDSSNAVRVTFDRSVNTHYKKTLDLTTRQHTPYQVFGNQVVLEIKFTNRYPDWIREMIQLYNLQRCGAAKYVDGINLMKHPDKKVYKTTVLYE